MGGYSPLKSWDINGWFGQSLDNKPYITVDPNNHLFISDPEGNRVLEFTRDGEIIRYWGDYSLGPDGFNLAGSVAADQSGGVWVTDVNNGRLMHFQLPED
jgi:streptogramin lyase